MTWPRSETSSSSPQPMHPRRPKRLVRLFLLSAAAAGVFFAVNQARGAGAEAVLAGRAEVDLETLVRAGVEACPRYSQPVPQHEDLIRILLHIEDEAGFPAHARGLLVAAACWESTYRANPGKGDSGRAVGLLQWHGWARRSIQAYRQPGSTGDPRLDPIASALFWADRVARYATEVVPRVCPRAPDPWRTAAAKAVRGPGRCIERAQPKPGKELGRCVKRYQRCRESSAHWRLMRRWHTRQQ
jgi:hypothetical protein